MEPDLREFIVKTAESRTASEMVEDTGFCSSLLSAIFGGIDGRLNGSGRSVGMEVLEQEFERSKE